MKKRLIILAGMLVLLLGICFICHAEIIDSGTCGFNLTWTLNDEGLLTIDGTGQMDDNTFGQWSGKGYDIKEVIIGNGVTSIGSYAFSGQNLVNVSIPNSVTSIGREAFRYCKSLSSITIPDSVTSIGPEAFQNCNNMTSVTIQYGVTSIGDEAFSGCSSLAIITIPDSVTSIGSQAFAGCSSLATITIPDSVTSIGYQAFRDCSNMTNVTIQYGVTSIGKAAFFGCSSLESVAIPDSVTSIGSEAFAGCSSLASITISDSVTSIEVSTFYGCNSLASITIPESITSIGDYAFYDCNGLASITIPDSVTSIGCQAFGGCSSLASITIPDSVTSIERYAFSDCSSLESVAISNSVTSIGDYAFSGCSNLASVAIPNSVTSIGVSAFSNCSSLKSVTISDSVTNIAGGIFSGCSSLASITIPDSVTSISERAFYDCNSMTSITIPDSLANIGNEAFLRCPAVMYAAIKTDGAKALGRAGYSFVDKQKYPDLQLLYLFDDGNDKGIAIVGADEEIMSVVFPDETVEIRDGAFGGCKNLTSVTIPKGVTYIGYYAFNYCSNLQNVIIPDGVTAIGSSAFNGCSSLVSLTIPEGLTSIDDSCFFDCSSLKKVYIPRSVKEISGWGFGLNNTMTIYCFEFSYAESWANNHGLQVVLLDGTDPVTVSVELPEEINVPTGHVRQIPAVIFPTSASQKVTWESSNPDIMTVDDTGIVTILKPGNSKITVTVDGVSASSMVHALPPADEIVLPEEILVEAKATGTFTVGFIPKNSMAELSYEIEDTTYADVDENGIITGKAVGETSITVRDKLTGEIAKTKLVVCYPVTEIILTPAEVSLKIGETQQLTADVTMRTQTCRNQLVTYASSDESIATVDRNGLIRGVAFGEATITATSGSGVVGSVTVNISRPSLPGDINQDGIVDGRDVIRLMNYLAEEIDPATGKVYEIHEDNADVDGNGVVDAKDLLRIVKYLGGENVELLPGNVSGNG